MIPSSSSSSSSRKGNKKENKNKKSEKKSGQEEIDELRQLLALVGTVLKGLLRAGGNCMVIYTDPIDNRYKSIFNHQEELETKLKNRDIHNKK